MRAAVTLPVVCFVLGGCQSSESAPVVSYPIDAADSEVEFALARDISYTGDRVLVTDMKLPGVVILDKDGRVAGKLGGAIGSGPGEYKSPTRSRGLPGGVTATFDRELRRITIYDAQGTVAGVVPGYSTGFSLATNGDLVIAGGKNGALMTTVSLTDSLTSPSIEMPRDARKWVEMSNSQLELNGSVAVLVDPYFLTSLQRVDLTTGDRDSIGLPEWLEERIGQKRSERARMLASSTRSPLITLFQNAQLTPQGTLWISTGWTELLGFEIDLHTNEVKRIVVPSDNAEYRGMVGSVLTSPETLMVLRATGITKYRLAPGREPEWIRT